MAADGQSLNNHDEVDTRVLGSLKAARAEMDRCQVALGGSLAGTPPLPLFWPPRADRRMVIYGYVMRLDNQRLSDAVWISRPCARVFFDPSGHQLPQGEVMVDEPGDFEPQGVRPLTRSEEQISAISDIAVGKLLRSQTADTPPSLDPVIATYYRFWRGTNGVIAGAIRPHHRGFFEALDTCEIPHDVLATVEQPVPQPGDCPSCRETNPLERPFCRRCGSPLAGT